MLDYILLSLFFVGVVDKEEGDRGG